VVFLNEKEKGNIVQSFSLKIEDEAVELSNFFNPNRNSSKQIIIIKNKAYHRLFNLSHGNISYRRFWHQKVKSQQIHNDTGAGDAFAGGFIAGMLSDFAVLHQPFPIRLGAIAASARMRASKKSRFPIELIRSDTGKLINQYANIERLNFHQRFKLFYSKAWPILLSSISAFVLGLLASLLASRI